MLMLDKCGKLVDDIANFQQMGRFGHLSSISSHRLPRWGMIDGVGG